jgi:HK97 family phage major capsid protein
MSEYIKRQHDLRQAAWHEAKQILDTAGAENRDLTSEEQEKYDRISADLDTRAAVIEQLKADEERAARLDAVAAEIRTDEVPAGEDTDAEAIRKLARGEMRSFEFEKRDVLTSSTGSPVPTSFYDMVILRARLVGPMLDVPTVLNTAGGENLQIPSLGTYSTSSTVTAQGANFSESDPAFNSFTTLGAFKYGFIIQLSRELIEDAGVDITSFLAEQIGNGLGYNVQAALTTGAGTTAPTGIVTAAGSGITGSTAVSGAFTADNVIDLVYSLDGSLRNRPTFAMLANSTSIAALRKLKDSQGRYFFDVGVGLDKRDLVLGVPVIETPAMPSPATGANSLAVGDLKSLYIRNAGGLQVDRSDDFAFGNDLATWRATWRIDSALVQKANIKKFKGGAS